MVQLRILVDQKSRVSGLWQKRFVALGLSLLISPFVTYAQQNGDQNSDQLEQIVVSARKRDESVQSVPASVTALSADDLAQRGIVSLRDLASALPGINLSGYEPDHANISIRGVTTGTDSPTVGFYVDDVPLSSGNSQFGGQAEPPIFDTQRVEVLKGPQGTLYGASAMGGAIKFVSNPVNMNQNEFRTSGGVSNTQGGSLGYQAQGIANLPVIDGIFAIRVGADFHQDGGYVDRIAHGEGTLLTLPSGTFQSFNSTVQSDINTYKTAGARVAMSYTPTDALSFDLDTYYQERHAAGSGQFWPNLPRFQQSDAVDQPIRDRLTFPILTIADKFAGLELTSITGYVSRRREQTTDDTFFTGALVPPFASLQTPSMVDSPITNLSQEIRLSNSAPDARTRFVTGLYYQRENFAYAQDVLTIGSGAGIPPLPADEVFYGRTDTLTKQEALFGELTFGILDDLDLSAGGRLFHISQTYSRQANGIFNGGPSLDFTKDSENGFSPKVELTYKIVPDHLAYVLADKGFRPGGGNNSIPVSNCASDLAKLGLSGATSTYRSDSLWNYEIGTKNTFADNRVVLNAAAFYIDWKNIQQTVILPTCGFGFVGNVGAATIKGGELEFRASPLHGVTLGLSATYADSRISEASIGTQAQVGDPIEDSPKFVTNANLEYAFSVSDAMSGFVRADYQWHGSQTQSFNRTVTSTVDPYTAMPYDSTQTIADPSYLQASYDLLNFAVGLNKHNWSARLYLDNVANKHPLLTVGADGSQTTAYTLPPRTLGIVVSTHFD